MRGIPRIEGRDVLDLARRQGEDVARTRTWQIVLDGWRVRGVTAPHLGAAWAPWDEFARWARLEDVARRSHERLEGEDRAFVGAFVEGVNMGLASAAAPELDGLGPVALWEPWMPAGIFALNHVLFSSFPTKLWRAAAAEVVGADVIDLFHGEPLRVAGSNAVVVGGDLTASGYPIVAGDPHRLFEAPNVYQQVHLVAPGIDVTGFTFPGVPGVQHFAHAGEVAWGITHAMADYQDIVGGELRTPAGELGDLGFAALLPLLRARSTADVLAAFEHWVEPVNHLLVADRSGRIARRVVGRVPQRDERAHWYPADDLEWSGWVDLPGADVGPDEVVVTANQRLAGFEEFGVEFAPPYRAKRIAELLEGRTGLTADDVAEVLTDDRRPERVLDLLLAGLGVELDEASFRAVRDEVVAVLTDLPALAPLGELDGGFYAPWFAPGPRIAHALDRLLTAADLLGFDPATLVLDAVRRAGGCAAAPLRFAPAHGLGWAVPDAVVTGDPDAVCAISGVPGTAAAVRGPVARYVWDLGDRAAGGWVVPLGADGDLSAGHGTDQLDLWLRGQLVPLAPYADEPGDPMSTTLATQDHPGLGTLTLTEVDPVGDLDLLADWLTAERARYWGMTDYTRDDIAEVYGWLDEQSTHAAYLVRLDGDPVALVQSYLPEADVIGEAYDRQPGDIGLHFFVGPGERRPDFSGRVVVFFCRYLFNDPARRRVVVEPDVRNQPAIARLVRMGCVLGPIADVAGPLPELPGKTAQFAFMTRERFAELYDVAPEQPALSVRPATLTRWTQRHTSSRPSSGCGAATVPPPRGSS